MDHTIGLAVQAAHPEDSDCYKSRVSKKNPSEESSVEAEKRLKAFS